MQHEDPGSAIHTLLQLVSSNIDMRLNNSPDRVEVVGAGRKERKCRKVK